MCGRKVAVSMVVVLVLWGLTAPAPACAAPTVVNTRVGAGSDDARENYLYAVSLADAPLDIGGADHRVGLRFASVNVPRNAKILTAYVEFTAAASDSAAATYTINGIAEDNPATFSTATANIYTRQVYGDPPPVSWTPAAWTTGGVYQTAELKDIVQKIVNDDDSRAASIRPATPAKTPYRVSSSWRTRVQEISTTEPRSSMSPAPGGSTSARHRARPA